MTQRQSFFDATKLHGGSIWNKVIEWEGYTFGTVLFHADREWKVLEQGTTWEQAKDRHYKPVAEFHTQQELWEYVKGLNQKQA